MYFQFLNYTFCNALNVSLPFQRYWAWKPHLEFRRCLCVWRQFFWQNCPSVIRAAAAETSVYRDIHILRKHTVTIGFLVPAVLASSLCSFDHYASRIILFRVTITYEHLGDSDADGGVILRWTFRKWDVGVWTGLSWLRIGTVGGAFVNAAMNLLVA